MKKFILLVGLCLAIVSCSSEKSVQKDIAKTMQNVAKNPESMIISDVKIIYQSNNYTVADFTFRGQNGFGGYSVSYLEYVKAKDINSVFVFDTKSTKPIVNGAESSLSDKSDISTKIVELTITTNLFKYMNEAIYSNSIK